MGQTLSRESGRVVTREEEKQGFSQHLRTEGEKEKKEVDS